MNDSSRYRIAALLAIAVSYPVVIGVYIAAVYPWQSTQRLGATAAAPQVLAAYLAMMLAAVLLAPSVGPRAAASFCFGVFSTAMVFLLGVVSGCLAGAFIYPDFAMSSHVFKPVFWISAYGLAPACLLGIVTTLFARLARSCSNEPNA
jgi:hypothetical protein